jgi:ribose/xylose/arabinose/galactoside ABC-type transport system permease subunit
MTTPPLPYATPRPDDGPSAGELLAKLGPLLGLVLVFVLFATLRPRSFATPPNVELMLRQTAVVGVAALGMTLIIISGGIDLSVGANIALCTVSIALLLNHGMGTTAAALGGVAASAGAGLLIGVLVTRLRMPPFIVTLGFWSALRGTAKLLADQQVVYAPTAWRESWLNGLLRTSSADTPGWVLWVMALWVVLFAAYFISRLIGLRRGHVAAITFLVAVPAAAAITGRIVYRAWPLWAAGVWVLLVLAVIVAGVLRLTRFGRHVFAIGSNEQAALLCGVPVVRAKVLVYTLAGMLVGIAGVLEFSYIGMGDPTTRFGAELDVIAAVVFGGASLSGGQGSVLGSLVGALIMTMIANGCTKMGWPNPVQEVVTGAIIVLAVALDRLRHRRA